jgi:hypothetical protein
MQGGAAQPGASAETAGAASSAEGKAANNDDVVDADYKEVKRG